MSLPIPNLDTKQFDALFEEARARIPQYAPEWTDHNTHDPGITLIELIAFFVDAQMYEVGFLSDRHYIAFAALLGITPLKVKPGRGLIWPPDNPVDVGFPPQAERLKKGAKVRCTDLPDLGFQTTAAVHFSAAQILHVSTAASIGGQAHNTVMQIETVSSDRIAAIPLSNNQNTLATTPTREATPTCVEILLDRPILPGESEQISGPISLGIELDGADQAPLDTEPLPGRLQIDYRLDLPEKPWWRVEIDHDGTQALNYTGIVLFRIPQEARRSSTGVGSRLRIKTRGRVNPYPPCLKRISLNVLPIAQLETKPAAAFPRLGNGEPDQEFELTLTGLPEDSSLIAQLETRPAAPIPHLSRGEPDEEFELTQNGLPKNSSLTVQVEDKRMFQTWEPVDDLSKSGPDCEVYELRVAENRIVFGNGVNGRIPAKDAQIRHLDYTLSAGSAGNLAPGLNWEVPGAPALAGHGVFGHNPLPVAGGEDAWTIQRLRREARTRALERRVMLTNNELESAALGLPGLAVNKADVLVGNYPGWPDRTVPGARSLVLRSDRADNVSALTPTSAGYVDEVRRLLLPRRVLGERLSILAAMRIEVRVRARLLVEDGCNVVEVKHTAVNRLNARLSDIKTLANIEPWPIGRQVTVEEMKTLLAQVDGVVAVTACTVARGASDFGGDPIALGSYEIAIGTEHELETELTRERSDP